MVLRIDASSDGHRTVLRLSGTLHAEQLPQLEAEIAAVKEDLTLDLGDLRLIDRESVSFLAASEARGVRLRHCPRYICHWIARARGEADGR
jgi:ABC-type transporter Mla MlaB component